MALVLEIAAVLLLDTKLDNKGDVGTYIKIRTFYIKLLLSSRQS